MKKSVLELPMSTLWKMCTRVTNEYFVENVYSSYQRVLCEKKCTRVTNEYFVENVYSSYQRVLCGKCVLELPMSIL